MSVAPMHVGFWAPEEGIARLTSSYPDPRSMVDPSWAADERAAVVAYLKAGLRVNADFGESLCRICECRNGSTDLGDGSYVWPEGFAHYLEVHDVKPPQRFIAHVLQCIGRR